METKANRKFRHSRFAHILILALVYFVSGKLGLHLAFVDQYTTAVWPPAGLALAGLLVWGLDVWPGVFLGSFLVNLSVGNLSAAGVLASVAVAAGNTLAAIAGTYLVNLWANGTRAFERVRDVFFFAGLAGFLSTTVSATVGVTILSLAHLAPWASYRDIWFTWWVGDAFGNLIFAPLVLLWAADHRLRWTRQRVPEAALATLGLVFLSIFVFTRIFPPHGHFLALALLGIVPLCWIAFRFGQRETATAIFVMSSFAIWGATHGLMSDLYKEPRVLLDVQEYIGISAILFLVLATEVSVRKRHENALTVQAEALQRYARLVDLGAVIVRDASDRIVEWSSGAEHLYGYTSAEAIGRFSHSLLGVRFSEPGARERIRAQIFAQGRWEGELRHLRRDGRELVVASLQVLHRDKRGAPAAILEINNDVTVQKQAEIAVRESEEQLRFALQAAGMHAWEWDLGAGQFVRSQNALAVWGVDDQSAGAFTQLIVPEDFDRMKQATAEAITGRAPLQIDQRIVRPDGQHRWVSTRAEVRYGPGGRPWKLSGVTADITERKRAEENLRLIIESVPNAIVVADPAGRIALVNSQTEKLFGYAREELLGRPVEALVPERFRKDHQGYRRAFFTVPNAQPMGMGRELFGLRKDGTTFPIEVGLSPFHTEEGIWVNAAITDITERQRVEREHTDLAAREQAFAAQRQLIEIVAGAPDFIKMVNPQSRVIYLNPAGRKMVGLTGDEDMYERRMEDFHPRWAWEVMRTIALPEADRSGFWSGELALQHADGHEIPVSQTIVAHRGPEGSLLGYSSIARDISEMKKTDRAIQELAGRLIHAQEEERSRIGRELHDHVAQMLALVAMQLDLENRFDLAKLAKQAADDVRQLSHRLHSSKLQDFGLIPTLDSLVNEFRERRGIAVNFEATSLPPALPLEINVCLLRIVEECLNNIARHSGAKSSLVRLKADDRGIHLSIQDDGTGFDPVAAQESGGLGLLSIRERLRVVHGEMRIHSQPLRGSTIDVSIPAETLRSAKSNLEARPT